MGLTNVQMKVKNPANPKKVFKGEFLVVSGTPFTVVPEKELLKMGIKPTSVETFYLTDGKAIRRKVGNALYEYQGVERAAIKLP